MQQSGVSSSQRRRQRPVQSRPAETQTAEASQNEILPHHTSTAPVYGQKRRTSVNASSTRQASIDTQTADTAVPEQNDVATESQTDAAAPSAVDAQEADKDDEDICWICAEKIQLYALGPCSHRTCHICCLRLRALYKTETCTFCKEPCPSVIFTSSPTLNFDDFTPEMAHFIDHKLRIHFETKENMEDSIDLLRYSCPQCKEVCSGWRDLTKHAKEKHDKVLCDLCTRNMKIFAHEHSLYTKAELKQHNDPSRAITNTKRGGPASGSSQISPPTVDGFTGHPSCEFCRILFFDADALFKHCRDRHEQCFICVRNGTGRDQYFVDYDHLEEHFDKAHYACKSVQCREKKFIVFETAVDLQAHMVTEHQVVGDKRATKDARRIETNFFVAGPSGQQNRHQQNHAPAALSAAQPEASTSTASPAPRLIPGLVPSTRSNARAPNFGGHLSSETPILSAESTSSVSPEIREKHSELMTQVATLLDSDHKVQAFKSSIRSFRNSESSARDLLDTLYQLFDKQTETVESVISQVIDLLDVKDKSDDLSKTMAAFYEEKNPFPTLGNMSLAERPKNTAVNRQGSQNNPAIWARVQQAATSTTTRPIPGAAVKKRAERFPPLSAASPAMVVKSLHKSAPTTAWSSSAKSASSSGRSTPTFPPTASSSHSRPVAGPSSVTVSQPARKPAAGPSKSEFPGLPSSAEVAASKARAKSYFTTGTNGSTTAQSWGPSAGTSRVVPGFEDDYETDKPELNSAAGGRKKQKQKMLLYSNSAF